MLTHQSLLTVIHRQKYTTLKSLSQEVQKTAKRLGQPISMSYAYELTRTNLLYLERQHKIKRSNKGKTFYISTKRYKEVIAELKQKLLSLICQGHNTPSHLRSIPLTSCKERISITLVSKLLKELEQEGKIRREGATSKGRSKIYVACHEPEIYINENIQQKNQATLLNIVYKLSKRQAYTSAHEVARKSDLPLDEVKQELKNLCQYGLLNEKTVGFLSLYQINHAASLDISGLELGILFDETNSDEPFQINKSRKKEKSYLSGISLNVHPAFITKHQKPKKAQTVNDLILNASAPLYLRINSLSFALHTAQNENVLPPLNQENHLALAPPQIC